MRLLAPSPLLVNQEECMYIHVMFLSFSKPVPAKCSQRFIQLPVFKQAQNLFYRIKSMTPDAIKCSNPSEKFDLPFPFLGQVPLRFDVKRNESSTFTFSYMGRQGFA